MNNGVPFLIYFLYDTMKKRTVFTMRSLTTTAKVTGHIRIWTSLLLLVLCFAITFMPLISLKTSSHTADIQKMLNSITQSEESFDIPDSVDISMPKLISSFFVIGDVISIAADTIKAGAEELESGKTEEIIESAVTQKVFDETVDMMMETIPGITREQAEQMAEEQLGGRPEVQESTVLSDAQKKLQKTLGSKEGRDTIILVSVIVTTIMDGFSSDTDSTVALVVGIVTLVAMIALLIFMLIFPIRYLITVIICSVIVIKKHAHPIEAGPAVSSKLEGTLKLPLIFLVFQCFLPMMTYTVFSMLLWIFPAIAVLMNTVFSRLNPLTKPQFKYMNVLQGMSLVGVVGYLMFFFCALQTNMIPEFLHGEWLQYSTEVHAASQLTGKTAVAGYLIDAALIALFAVGVLESVSYFKKTCNRLSCSVMNKHNKARISDSCLPSAIVLTVFALMPLFVIILPHNYSDPFDASSSASSFLTLTAEENLAYILVLVGAFLLLSAEITLLILKKTVCTDTTPEERTKLITSDAFVTVEDDPTPVAVSVDAAASADAATATAIHNEIEAECAAEPAVEPAAEPAVEPAAEPTVEPTAEPAAEPAIETAVESSQE
jgi:hypothetical protein